ncbi:MAG: GatB/YqeY domain-containing protein, partial [Candidatus Fonsibacter sp.]
DEDVVTVLNKMLKQRKESLEIYKQASRKDLSEKEEKEIQIIQSFLPKQLDDAETKKVCEEAVKSSNASSIKDMGKVMGILKVKYASTLDFAKAGVILKSLLNK